MVGTMGGFGDLGAVAGVGALHRITRGVIGIGLIGKGIGIEREITIDGIEVGGGGMAGKGMEAGMGEKGEGGAGAGVR